MFIPETVIAGFIGFVSAVLFFYTVGIISQKKKAKNQQTPKE